MARQINIVITLAGILFQLCLVNPQARSQNISDLVYSGDALFLEGNYYAASQYYYQAFNIDTTRLRTAFKYADCCRLFFNYPEAARMYQYVISRDEKNKFPEARFWLGMTNKNLGIYEEALLNFQRYMKENHNPRDGMYIRALTESEACVWAKEAIKNELPVRLEHPGRIVNSEYSDFGAIQLGDSLLYYSSLQLENDLPLQGVSQGNYLTKLYESRITPASYATPVELPAKINATDLHNANICFFGNHQLFFFTRCTDERRPDLQCEIYMVNRKGGKWQKPVKLDNAVNMPGYTTTQPTLAHGEKEDILYFVSDRPGGMGGKDIWYSVIKRGKVSKPSNLGSIINTPGDEITPYYHKKTNTLFFSSDYHKGFGGFDIFRSKGAFNQWTKPLNAGYPLSTPYNDLYFTVNETDTNGYLTSNRPGSFYIKNQTCCNDIWSYKYEKKEAPPLPFTLKTDTSAAKTEYTDNNGSNEDLIREFLPLTLYFHNDEPDPATTKEYTSKNYKTTVADYLLLKDKYSEEYSRGLTGEEKIRAENDIEDFFNDYVLSGMNILDEFTSLLAKDLAGGNSVVITIKGFTSPLNTPEYNKKLAKRRIASLINYFREYRNGQLIPYMKAISEENNTLTFIEEPIGEEQSDKLVSDNPNDLRNSIYSRAAALERRIQILYYDGQ
ncbi:MAG: hypothetical protein AB9842_09965 [Bacteroidales bacterium]